MVADGDHAPLELAFGSASSSREVEATVATAATRMQVSLVSRAALDASRLERHQQGGGQSSNRDETSSARSGGHTFRRECHTARRVRSQA
jgi:hypothetical protein